MEALSRVLCGEQDVLEGFYYVRAENDNSAKRLFRQQYRDIAAVYEEAARLLKIAFNEVLRAYPAG